MNIDQIITAGAGVVALLIIFKVFLNWQDKLQNLLEAVNITVQNNTAATAEVTKAMERMTESLQRHDTRACEIEAKIESSAETVEARLKETVYSNQVIRDKVMQIETHLQQGRR